MSPPTEALLLTCSRLGEKAGGGKAAPIITHCGGGGRGQKAKDYLDSQGFTNVVNGGVIPTPAP